MGAKNVVAMPARVAGSGQKGKAVEANQAAIDALQLNSGDWSVSGVPGLQVRCGATSKSYRLQRRVRGVLVKRVLGEMTLAQARRAAMKEWINLKPRPEGGVPSLDTAWRQYVVEKDLAERSREGYLQMLGYLPEFWRNRPLDEIGHDRAGVRALYHEMGKKRGRAVTLYTFRVLRAVYNYSRKVIIDLPENPCVVVDLPQLPARDWGMSDDELRQWWKGVQSLRTTWKRVWWQTALLTGARATSVSRLQWADVNMEKRVVHFKVTKGDRPYSIPMSDHLVKVLREYREDAIPSEWVFPSPLDSSKPLHRQVRDDKRGVVSPHHLRHTMRTRLAAAGATPDLARVALGHALNQDVSQRYVTSSLLVEAVRPLMNAVAGKYAEALGW